jgi:sugar phosphate isomerase/epimerase
VKIAFENWPGLTSSFPPVQTVNFCFTPSAWEQMFNRVDSDAIGLEFDPSHLMWQSIDWAGALKKFLPRVHHAHAKDTEIFHDRLSTNGFFSRGWWRYRLPGYGLVDWHKFTSMLKEGGYDGGICVEHEDPIFSGSRREEGLKKAHDYLRPLV